MSKAEPLSWGQREANYSLGPRWPNITPRQRRRMRHKEPVLRDWHEGITDCNDMTPLAERPKNRPTPRQRKRALPGETAAAR